MAVARIIDCCKAVAAGSAGAMPSGQLRSHGHADTVFDGDVSRALVASGPKLSIVDHVEDFNH